MKEKNKYARFIRQMFQRDTIYVYVSCKVKHNLRFLQKDADITLINEKKSFYKFNKKSLFGIHL